MDWDCRKCCRNYIQYGFKERWCDQIKIEQRQTWNKFIRSCGNYLQKWKLFRMIMQACDLVLFIQEQGKSEFNLLCRLLPAWRLTPWPYILFISAYISYSYVFQLKFYMHFLSCWCILSEGHGEIEKCMQNCSQKTYTKACVYKYILNIQWAGN